MAREKWEYEEGLYLPADDGGFVNFLNEYGKEGWELVITEKKNDLMIKCVFKRSISGI